MIPDLLYDLHDLYTESDDLNKTIANVGHVALDFPSWIPGVKGDDALEIGGIVDDGVYASSGKQIEEHVRDVVKVANLVNQLKKRNQMYRRTLEAAGGYENIK